MSGSSLRAIEGRQLGVVGRFAAAGEPARLLPHVISLPWEMVTVAGGEHAGGGVTVVELDGDGRIRLDYQFIEP